MNIGERNREATRVVYKAKMTLLKQQTRANWIVGHFVDKHNHILSNPRKVHLLRSHKVVSTAKKVFTKQLSEANKPTCQHIRVMEIKFGGP